MTKGLKKEAEHCVHEMLFWLNMPINEKNVKDGSYHVLKLLKPRENRIAELEAQIEKMKCCEMCKHKNLNLAFSPICEARDKITIENPLTCKCDRWSMRNDR